MLNKVMEAGFEEKTFDTGELKLNYVVGPDNGPPVVLIPAQTGIWESYAKVLPAIAKRHRVYAIDVRGHGKSDWATGDYSWASIGRDMTAFLTEVVRDPAIISGNSSGGIIALWCAANLPERVAGIIIEDAPLFSAEWPRMRDRDKVVYRGLSYLVATLGDPANRSIGNYFSQIDSFFQEIDPEVRKRMKVKRPPSWLINFIAWIIRREELKHPGQPVDVKWLPGAFRLMIKCYSMFDPDFARAFTDGRFYEGIDHADALSRANCPILILHSKWDRDPDFGLIGAMDDEDGRHAVELAPHAIYHPMKAGHVIHFGKPKLYLQEFEAFARLIRTGRAFGRS